MRIGGSREGAFRHGEQPPRGATLPAAPASRALTVVSASAQRDVPQPLPRGDAAFLAHLIATREQAPQTREKRRAEPAEALAAYRAVTEMVG
jgi:hypothetical protein